jgi:hypothetical protein
MLDRFALLAVIISTVVAATNQAPVAKRVDEAAPPLRLSLRVDQQSYRMSDTMTLETQLTNVSSNPVFLNEWDLCWSFARGLVLRVIDAKGSDVRTDLSLDCVPPPPRPGDVYQFVKIDGGRFYGCTSQFVMHDIVNTTGEYDLDVSFESSISAKWVSEYLRNDPIGKLPLWTREKPPLKALRIHIKVIS